MVSGADRLLRKASAHLVPEWLGGIGPPHPHVNIGQRLSASCCRASSRVTRSHLDCRCRDGLSTLVQEYLATRRALGAKLEQPASLLCRLVLLAAHCDAAFLTVGLALSLATEARDASPAWWARLVSVNYFFRRR